MSFKDSMLWKEAFHDKYEYADLRKRLNNAFDIAHNNASFLLGKIRIDFPSLTIHDITHVDSLWQVASIIAGDNYPLNPLEGFVLGCSFLIHDAALSYFSVGGKDRLRSTTEWKDFYSDYVSRTDMTDEEKEYETDFRTIRYLHAKCAKELCNQLFEREDGSTFYIIEDDELRKHLWQIIGDIAASHHWNIDKVKTLGTQLPALAGFPVEWRVNPLKLACLLRCADAGHIDSGRAPDYLLKLLDINGVSRNHWEAQNKLSQIDIDETNKSNVIIASNIAFSESDYAAWNVVYDAVTVLNNELIQSYEVLNSCPNTRPFQARRVSGAESREKLCNYVKTIGWFPCDASIHISNIEGIIKTLGGEKLYGKEKKIEYVIRELIQNARDAIVARKYIDDDGFVGRIDVCVEEKDNNQWLIVKDNGIGMSMQTIKSYLLNFGESFWASDLAKNENPGLCSSGFKSIGQFGIGFYSIFMIASEVIVETRKFNEGLDSNIKLRFPNGLCLRPIVSQCKGNSMNVSTIVKVCINPQEAVWKNVVKIHSGMSGVEDLCVPFKGVLANITAGLDVNVHYKELECSSEKVHEDINSKTFDKRQWLIDATYANYHENTGILNYVNNNYNRLRYIYHNGHIIGLAALNTLYQNNPSYLDIHTVGGLSTFSHSSGVSFYMGYISTEPETAKRDGKVINKMFNEWIIEQYTILLQKGLTDNDKLWLPYNLCSFDIDLSDILKICFINKSHQYFYDLKSLLFMISQGAKLVFAISPYGKDDRIDTYTDIERSLERLDNNEFLFIPCTNSNFLNTQAKDNCCFNIISCIKTVAAKMKLQIRFDLVENKTHCRIGGIYKGLVLSGSIITAN